MGLTAEQRRMVVVLLVGALVVVLNQTLLSPALPVIMDDMHVDATTVQWLTSGYSLVEAVVIPLSAYLMGRFSTRKLFIGGMCLFAAGTLLAAAAPMFIFLLLGRMLQASATGFVMPMVFSIIVLIFPREHRGSAMGLISLIIGFAPAVGPSLSGVLVESVGWRVLFIIVAALAVIIILAAAALLKNVDEFERTTFDKPSVILSCCGLLSLLYGLSSVTSTEYVAVSLILIVVGAVLMVFFVRRQLKLPVPFLRVQVLKTRNYRMNVIVVASFQAALVGCGVLLPIMLQNVLGATPLQTGLIMLPGAVIGAITAMLAGRLFDKLGVRKLAIPGTFIAMVGGFGMVSIAMGSSLIYVTCIYLLLALGLEFTMTPLNTWGINSLPNSVIQHANATSNTINQIAASLGTAVLVSLSATSSIFFPDLSGAEQQMAGIHIAFLFSAIMMALIFLLVVFTVKDRNAEPGKKADYVAEEMPVQMTPTIEVGEVMRKEPYFVTDKAAVREVMHIMTEHKTSGVPVVDGERKVIGFVSDGDIMKYLGRKDVTVLDSTMMLYQVSDDGTPAQRVVELLALPVKNIATMRAVSVSADTAVEDVCRLLSEKRIKKVPVVDADGKLIGSLSRSDVIRSTMEHLEEIEALARDAGPEHAEVVG